MGEEVGRERFNGLADLDQANADGVENQFVGEITTNEVGGVDRREDVIEALAVATAHKGRASVKTECATPSFRLLA